MKIAFISDIHLEHKGLILNNTENADVLILAGDLLVENDLQPVTTEGILLDDFFNIRSKRYHEFLQDCSIKFKHILFVVGNHEHYHGDFKFTVNTLKSRLKYISNLHILDKESIIIDDVKFLGCTLWSDMNSEDLDTINYINRSMNDFRIIKNSNDLVNFKVELQSGPEKCGYKTKPSRFTPYHAIEEHKLCLEFLDNETKSNEKIIVITHHAPSFDTIEHKYKSNALMNGGFCSNLNKFIEDRPQISNWIFGHQHQRNTFSVGKTTLHINARGYPGELLEVELKYINIASDNPN